MHSKSTSLYLSLMMFFFNPTFCNASLENRLKRLVKSTNDFKHFENKNFIKEKDFQENPKKKLTRFVLDLLPRENDYKEQNVGFGDPKDLFDFRGFLEEFLEESKLYNYLVTSYITSKTEVEAVKKKIKEKQQSLILSKEEESKLLNECSQSIEKRCRYNLKQISIAQKKLKKIEDNIDLMKG